MHQIVIEAACQPIHELAIEHWIKTALLFEQVHSFVTGVFQQCGISFENPTKDGIMVAINQCRSQAEQMMGDRGASVIRHHYAEMMKLVSRLPE